MNDQQEDSHRICATAAPLRLENLDTDQIVPKQFLTGIDKSGLARALLHDLRFDPAGKPNAHFVLNRPEYAGVGMLLGGANFGCGSSREHAVWSLQQFGIRAILAPSFAEIFYSNAINNRLLLVSLPRDAIEQLMCDVEADPQTRITIDVEASRVCAGGRAWTYALSERHKEMFLRNLDVIGLTLERKPLIDAFAKAHLASHPWVEGIASRNRLRVG